ncbi:hypothetical protein Pan97_30640 [Bremerella volcania]|uniref:Carboxypeptidase regulatory-like domain-containing protein n=1 Tax=Bremerella volcania TaxID=2527984 RepID=A0A518C9X0_9BACT|nr:hypothetical protein [Bremerella volcania]QDU76019.1 hypothetical protein Pan97_30640 [Bremerella volcania]
MMNSKLTSLILFMLAATLSCGCQSGDSGPPKYSVSGKVSYQGKPVEDGTIIFVPTTTGGGGQVGLPITNGTFQGEITAGAKRVMIEASRPGPPVTNDLGEVHQSQDWYIPVKYNEASELTYEVLPQENVEVNFELK